MSSTIVARAQSAWLGAMPGVFVLLWSTGFIGGKLGIPYAPPLTFLALRFVIVAILLLLVSFATRAPWPSRWSEIGHTAVAGLLVHGVYLGGVFASLAHGVQAGVSALIVGIQPLLVAAVAGPLLGERVTRLQWFGLVLGLIGIGFVVSDKLSLGLGTPLGMALSVLALIGMTLGTVYQKRFCQHMDLRTGNVIQFAATAGVVLVLAAIFETMQIRWTAPFVFALGWLCLVLSLGAITLLYLLIRRGAAAKVASLFYMVPPVTAVMAYFLFGETLSPLALFGMAVTVTGVALVNVRR
jgi:drug/metabolite transporter (DMT)-like permease